jgi:hypothetical protein
MNILNTLLQPWCLIVFAVVMFLLFLTIGIRSKEP